MLVNFIFTTCTTICPVMSAGMSQFLTNLGADRDRCGSSRSRSIPSSTPSTALRAYAARYHAPPVWRFLTGHAGGRRGGAAGLRQLSRRQEQPRAGNVRPLGAGRALDRARRLLERRDAAARVDGAPRAVAPVTLDVPPPGPRLLATAVAAALPLRRRPGAAASAPTRGARRGPGDGQGASARRPPARPSRPASGCTCGALGRRARRRGDRAGRRPRQEHRDGLRELPPAQRHGRRGGPAGGAADRRARCCSRR